MSDIELVYDAARRLIGGIIEADQLKQADERKRVRERKCEQLLVVVDHMADMVRIAEGLVDVIAISRELEGEERVSMPEEIMSSSSAHVDNVDLKRGVIRQ